MPCGTSVVEISQSRTPEETAPMGGGLLVRRSFSDAGQKCGGAYLSSRVTEAAGYASPGISRGNEWNDTHDAL